MNSLIELHELNPYYLGGQSHLFQDGVSFDINAGERVLIKGGNGSGKSTVLKVLAGVHRHFTGECKWKGESIVRPTLIYMRRRGIVFLPQHGYSIGSLTVREFCSIIVGRVAREVASRQIVNVVCRSLSPEQRISDLSGGEQQSLALAGVLSQDASLYILDEPFRSLDQDRRQAFARELMQRFSDRQATLVMTDHEDVLGDLGFVDRVEHV
jgi:ABC-type multidrug transport system ATPase subunit